LKVDCSADFDDNMASQLNPDAKEFVPLSPQRSTPTNPFAPSLHLIDDVIAQSPRKGTLMDDIPIPSENEWSEFENEISKRPHELESNVDDLVTIGECALRPGSATSNNENGVCAYQELNLKEAMQGDEKLEGEYNDETDKLLKDDKKLLPVDSEKSFKDEDPMNKSFYEGRGTDLMLTTDKNDELNKVQVLPNSEEVDENSCDESETNKENIRLSELSQTEMNINNGHHADTETVEEKAEIIESQYANIGSATIYSAAQELTENFSKLFFDVNGIEATNALPEQIKSSNFGDLPVESEQKNVLESLKPLVIEDSINNQIILSENPKEFILDQHILLETEIKDKSELEIDMLPKVEEVAVKASSESAKQPMKVTSSTTTAKPKTNEPKKSDIKIGTGTAKTIKKTTSATSNKPIVKSTTAAKPIVSRVTNTRPVSANITKTNTNVNKTTTTSAISGETKKTTPVKITPITRKTLSSVQASNGAVSKSVTSLTKSSSSKIGAEPSLK
jgi:Ataxin-2 C-terminal region